MGDYRNVTTLRGIEVTGRSSPSAHRRGIVLDAKYSEPRSDIESCRRCGSEDPKLYRHGWASVKINDTPTHGRPLGIRLKTQRYRCQECGQTFNSKHPSVHEKHNMTQALVRYIRDRGLKEPQVKGLAQRLGLGEGTVWNVLEERIEALNNASPSPPMRILGLDEIHMPSGEKHTVFTDLWHGTVVEFLESNKKIDVGGAIREIVPDPQMNPDLSVPDRFGTWGDWGVVAVVTDMESRYRDLVKDIIPRAKVVIDRYHVVDKARDALDAVRKRTTAKKDEQRKQKRKALGLPEPSESYVTRWKQRKSVFDRRLSQFSDSEWFRLEQDLRQLPELKDAYFAYDRFKQIYDYHDRQDARRALQQWKRSIPDTVYDAFEENLLETLEEWREEILNYFEIYPPEKRTNAGTEGLNRTIKQIYAEGAGYSSFEVLKAKVLERVGKRFETAVEQRGGFSIFRGNASSDHR